MALAPIHSLPLERNVMRVGAIPLKTKRQILSLFAFLYHTVCLPITHCLPSYHTLFAFLSHTVCLPITHCLPSYHTLFAFLSHTVCLPITQKRQSFPRVGFGMAGL